jgi:hypothetical protein
MAFIEVKTYKFICDSCGIEEIFQAPMFRRPDNWVAGKTNNPYAKFEYEKDICPDCKDIQRGK